MIQAENTFDEIDNLTIKPRKNNQNQIIDKSNVHSKQNIDVHALINKNEEEERSEVMSIRITPSARKKIEEIWLTQRKKRKKLKESTIAAEILMKVLEKY